MKARQLFRFRGRQGDTLVEMVVWQVPDATPERPHGLKYRLYCGINGICVVRCDNEAGKGDHRHYGEREERYRFSTLERLLADFQTDCSRLTNWSWS